MIKEKMFLWSRIGFPKRVFLLPLYLLIWNIEFVKHYSIDDVELVFYDNYLKGQLNAGAKDE